MFLKLRIFFTILSALCLGFALTAGALWGYHWIFILGLGALLFFMLMLICKRAQETKEQKEEEDKKFFNPHPEQSTDNVNDKNL